MSETGNPVTPAPVTAVTPAPTVAPTASEVVVQPVTAAVPTPTPVIETPAPAPVVAPVEAAPEATEEADTVLGEALKAEPPKVETPQPEVKVEELIKEEGQSDEPAPPPTYDPFTLPEGLSLEEDRVKEFTGILSEFEQKTKADHAEVQQFGQKAVDFHVAEVQKAVQSITQHMQDGWEKTKNDWKESFMSDPELGGNRWQTTVDSAMNFIRTHGGNADQQAEFRKLMNDSGIGNHPAMIRLLANAGIKMSEGKPLAATAPISPPKSKTATMYGRS